jgi:hypothetical protein
MKQLHRAFLVLLLASGFSLIAGFIMEMPNEFIAACCTFMFGSALAFILYDE